MNLTRNQLIIAGVTGLVVVVAGLIFTGIIPGLRSTGPEEIALQLNIWGVGDTPEAFETAFAEFNKTYKNVTFDYRAFPNEAAYESALLDALAAGTGPDIFAVRNDKLFRHLNKLAPAPTTLITLSELRALFPQIVEKDFLSNGRVYALPLSIDTLALFVNRDLLDSAGIANIPATWDEVQAAAAALTKRTADGAVTQSGIALGGATAEIESAVDALWLLMLQTGTKMTDEAFARAAFDAPEGLNALRFYLQFGNPSSASYSWGSGAGTARNRFADEKLAMLVDYASAIPALVARNAFLNYAVSPVPQPKDASTVVTYASYHGFGVSRRAKNISLAWQLLKTMAAANAPARAYADSTGRPPALRALVGAFERDLIKRVFARQILTARSWPQTDPDRVRTAFVKLIDTAVADPARAGEALRAASQEVTAMMSR